MIANNSLLKHKVFRIQNNLKSFSKNYKKVLISLYNNT